VRKLIKSYRELIRFPTFEERFEYLKLGGIVGRSIFGFDRYLNQRLYHSREWKLIRREVILRDNACDLAIPDRPIHGRIIVHHINPLTIEEIERGSDSIFNLNNLVCVSHNTSNAIHYGDASLLPRLPIERRKGDTCLWRVY
jgi:hypothetical protein